MGAPGKVMAPAARVVRAPEVRRQGAAVLAPSLRVGAVNDPAEHQAVKMAERVMAQAPASVPLTPQGGGPPLARDASGQPSTDELTAPPVPADFNLPASNDVATTGLSAEDVSEMEAGKPAGGDAEGPPPEAAPISPARPATAVVGREGGMAPADVAARVASPGAGRALPDTLRQRVEPHFGTTFDDVRLHDTDADRTAAARIGARAFTHGAGIWLGPGESASDVALMAHELTHVVQQTRDTDTMPRAEVRREEEEGYIAGKVEAVARQVPGYSLLTVLMGKTLFSGISVQRSATNLLGGLFGLVPGGTLIFDQLNETKAIDKAFAWVTERLDSLNITWDRISQVIDKAESALFPLPSVDDIIGAFKPLVDDILTFVGEITQKVLEFIIKGALALAGSHADEVWAVIEKAKGTLKIILDDPLAFAKNLIAAVVGGFRQFGSNILDHLKKGLLGWLFGAIADAGITLPAKLDFKGIISILLQILGITYANFRKILVKELGPKGEKMVAFIEKSVEVVQILLKEGFLGIWQKLIGMIENVKATIIGGMNEMVIGAIVKAGISWLAGLSNPVGAVVKVVLSIYDMVTTFIERAKQIWEVAQSIFASIDEIARGNVKKAVDFVEQTIGRTVPVVLSFLAALLGLNGIPSKIKAVFKKLQDPVAKAMTKAVQFVVKKAKKLFSKLIEKLNKARKLPGKTFKVGDSTHSVFAQKKGKGTEFMVASKPEPLATAIADTKGELPKIKEEQSKKDASEFVAELEGAAKETKPFQKIDTESAKTPTKDPVDKLDAALEKNAGDLTKEGAPIDTNIATTSKSEGALLRAKEPRIEGFEGEVKTYGELQKVRDGFKVPNSTLKVSVFYELDHTIEKRFPKGLLAALGRLKPKKDAKAGAKAVLRDGTPALPATAPAAEVADKSLLGKLGTADLARVDEDASRFPAIALYVGNHLSKKGKGLPDPDQIVEAALKTDPANPASVAKSMVKRQMEVEVAEIRSVVGKDKDATDAIKARVEAGLKLLTEQNTALYGLKDTPVAPPDPNYNGELKGGAGSTLSFDGAGMPDFAHKEGQGMEYGQRERGLGKFLEYDHIIDDAYPQAARGLRLLSESAVGHVEAAVRAQGRMTAVRAERLASLRRRDLFAGTQVNRYSQDAGWSVALYRVIHRQVTEDRGDAGKIADTASKEMEAQAGRFADYVISGDEADLTKAALAVRAPIKTLFKDRTKAHGDKVKDLYVTNEADVLVLNPENQAEAKAKMDLVRANVSAALTTAQSRTDALF
jgi:Domain of unknown function (DUF4157)